MSRLSAEQLEALRLIDSPTVSNAIEQFNVRSLVEGYAGWDLRCAFPEIGTTIGYAVTCTGDTTTASRTRIGIAPTSTTSSFAKPKIWEWNTSTGSSSANQRLAPEPLPSMASARGRPFP